MATSCPEDGFIASAEFTLERLWYDGQLLERAATVLRFIRDQRELILARAGFEAPAGALLDHAHQMIAARRSLHLIEEMRDQLREVQREIWIRGERGDHDRERIQLEWIDRHAAAWRDWRVREYQFVLERCAPLALELLRPPAEWRHGRFVRDPDFGRQACA